MEGEPYVSRLVGFDIKTVKSEEFDWQGYRESNYCHVEIALPVFWGAEVFINYNDHDLCL